jgi:bilirubin oxidase
VQLSPGERAEILVRMAPGETVVLRSEKPDLGGTLGALGAGNGGGDRFDVLELRAADSLRSAGTIPSALAAIDRLDPADAVQERHWELDGTQINQRNMDMDRIDAVAEVGTTEVWVVRNNMAFPHNFHVHDVQFQVLEYSGGPAPPQLAGWKDTVYLRPNETVRLIMRFDDYADPEAPYMFHCHLLRHEDNGMMGQFLVVEPGTDISADTGDDTTMMGDDHDHGHD